MTLVLVLMSIEKYLKIQYNTFKGCEKIKRVIIPESVAHISNCAFEDCPFVKLDVVEGSYAERFADWNGIEVSEY